MPGPETSASSRSSWSARCWRVTRPVLRISTAMLAPTAHDERAAIGATATAPARAPVDPPVDFDDTLSTGLHVVQREHILRMLNATHWVIEGNSGAAIKLGMKPATLRHRMKKLGIHARRVSAPRPRANGA